MRGDVKQIKSNGFSFDWIQGADYLPSNNPLDSPFDTFRCPRCGWEFKHQMGGYLHIPSGMDPMVAIEKSFDKAKKTIRLHCESRCEYITYRPLNIYSA